MSDKNEVQVRPIADFLAEHNRGEGAREASEALQEVVTAVKDTGKIGTVTITLKIEPMKQNPDTLMTTVDVKSKVPAQPRKAAIFFATDEGNLVREDPKQLRFDSLKEVAAPAEATELKEAQRPALAGGDA